MRLGWISASISGSSLITQSLYIAVHFDLAIERVQHQRTIPLPTESGGILRL